MSDITFNIHARWSGTGTGGSGTIELADAEVPYSVPSEMGGKGKGGSPETLLMAAVTACYSATLYHLLVKRRLPAAEVRIETKGIVSGYPKDEKYAAIEVNPSIRGGDTQRIADYKATAHMACERCFIGQTVAAGGVKYSVGSVRVTP